MSTDGVIQLLTYAQAELRPVRLVLRDGEEITGTPSNIDTDPEAYEVFLYPAGDDETEIGVSIAAIARAEML